VASDGTAVVVTAGGNMAFMNAVLAIADPGDEFILLSPYYFNHEMAITMASCKPVVVPTDANYQPRVDVIGRAVTGRTRAVVTISPNNPSGAVYSEGALRQINAICRERGIYHVSDEAYEYFTYDGVRHFSPGSIEDAGEHTISLFSLSKAYGFASWRIGYMAIPNRLFDPIGKIQDTILICPPVISQYAAVGAMSVGSSYCREKLRDVIEVRRLVQDRLGELGAMCTLPAADGAFYFLLKVHAKLSAMHVCERLVREHGVAVIPGGTFGIENECCLRIAYGALTRDTAAEGIGRFVKGLRAIVRGS
jgi:aspartate/methionine/tyrosine aminotransferase